MVKAFEPNAHRARPRADPNKADSLDDSVSGFGNDGESDNDVRTLSGLGGGTRLADSDGPFCEHPINILGDPPSDVVHRSNTGNNLAAEQSELLDRRSRIRQF